MGCLQLLSGMENVWNKYISHVFMVLAELLQKSVFQEGKEGKANDLLEILYDIRKRWERKWTEFI